MVENHILLRSLETDAIDAQMVFRLLCCLPYAAGAGLPSAFFPFPHSCSHHVCPLLVLLTDSVLNRLILYHVVSCREKFKLGLWSMTKTNPQHFIVKGSTEEKRLEVQDLHFPYDIHFHSRGYPAHYVVAALSFHPPALLRCIDFSLTTLRLSIHMFRYYSRS